MLPPGSTILIPSGPPDDPQRKHLHIVAARKSGPPPMILMVSVCTIRDAYRDLTTALAGGEHPCIHHPSYVRYSDARIDHERDIQRGIDNDRFDLDEPCSECLLQLVLGGFDVSKFAKPFTKSFVAEAD